MRPKSDTAIASTQANGPRPTTLIHTSAQISVSTPRDQIERTRRTGNRMMLEGTMFRTASRLTGNASTAAIVVPSSAIDSSPTPSDRPATGPSGGIVINVIQPSWSSRITKALPAKIEIDQPEHEDHRHDGIITPWAWRGAPRPACQAAGYLARNCSVSDFGNWLIPASPAERATARSRS